MCGRWNEERGDGLSAAPGLKLTVGWCKVKFSPPHANCRSLESDQVYVRLKEECVSFTLNESP